MSLRPVVRGVFGRFVVSILLFSLGAPCVAAPRASIFEREKQNVGQLSEYIYGDEVEQRLSPVYLLGAVARPGLYHVPPKTSLTTLLAIAGGPTQESLLDGIVIRNEESKRLETINYKKVMTDSEMKSPILQPRDVVLIDTRQPAISNNTITVLGATAVFLTVIMTGLLIKKEL